MLAEFDNTDTGVLFEVGGATAGTICHLHNGKLYLQSGEGDGTGTNGSRDRVEVELTVNSATTRRYCVRALVDKDAAGGAGLIQLWLNEQTIGLVDFNVNFFMAQNYRTGGVGKISDDGTVLNRG
ncbi:MAG: hypothetical protein AAFU61_17685, partial [Pseudomonadota bacterium]